MRSLLLAVSLWIAAATPSIAEVRIRSSPGGQMMKFIEIFERLRDSGERVVIDGPCYSACTLALSILPPEQVCVTPRAVLGFHGARSFDPVSGRAASEPRATQIVLESYPPRVQRWIVLQGGLGPRLLLLRGRVLAALVQTCR